MTTLACSINAVHLKDRLGDVETDCRNRLHDWLLRIVGALTAPTSMALTCRWRSRPQHKTEKCGERVLLAGEAYPSRPYADLVGEFQSPRPWASLGLTPGTYLYCARTGRSAGLARACPPPFKVPFGPRKSAREWSSGIPPRGPRRWPSLEFRLNLFPGRGRLRQSTASIADRGGLPTLGAPDRLPTIAEAYDRPVDSLGCAKGRASGRPDHRDEGPSHENRRGEDQETGRRIWKYRRIAKQALAAAKCLSVCPLRMNPTE